MTRLPLLTSIEVSDIEQINSHTPGRTLFSDCTQSVIGSTDSFERSLATDTVIGSDAHRTPNISSGSATPDWLLVMSTVTASMISIFARKTAFPTGSIFKTPTEP